MSNTSHDSDDDTTDEILRIKQAMVYMYFLTAYTTN
jgi:hypothetical protein